MKIPSVSAVLCNWITLKYVATVGVALSIDSSWCYPILLQKSLIRMGTSLVSQVKCQAFYCCTEENTLYPLDAFISTLRRTPWLPHQQHCCDLSLHNMTLCCCVECSHSSKENFVARVSYSCAFLCPASCPLSWTVSNLTGSQNAGTYIYQIITATSSYF